jgi:hypothetical protein
MLSIIQHSPSSSLCIEINLARDSVVVKDLCYNPEGRWFKVNEFLQFT